MANEAISNSKRVILGTRGSALALTQEKMTRELLEGLGFTVEKKIIATTGDKRQDLKLSAPDLDKAVFTKELEEALEAGEIDAAVHSLKDVPTILEDQFALVAVLPRAPIEDVIVGKPGQQLLGGIDDLAKGATVATSSVRRACQLRHLRPDLNVIDIRGNVPTRLRKVATLPEIDATVLARAGLMRLGYDLSGATLRFEDHDLPIHIVDPKTMIPAAGQGAIAIEIRAADAETAAVFGQINHEPTWLRIRAERAFLHALGAGCQTPVGVHTEFQDGNRLRMRAIVFQDDQPEPQTAEIEGDAADAEGLAASLMAELGSAPERTERER
ncbi:MAG: hydroxymethylbilane synthase [Verrucomicrobiales bacterium]|jgi:hydroxymethylbilane synthase